MTFEEMYYTQDGTGKVVLFLHGWGCDGDVWKMQKDFLVQCGFKVVCVDLYGFGNSPVPKKVLSILDYADVICRFIEKIGIQKCVICAHSFGARIATVVAAQNSHLLSALVLTGGAGLRNLSIKVALKIFLYKFAKCLSKVGLFSKNKLKKMGSADFRACNGIMRGIMCKATNLSTARYAAQIHCPTLLIWGENDKDTPLKMGKKYHKIIANSQLITLQSGHFCFLEQPKKFNYILSSFLHGI